MRGAGEVVRAALGRVDRGRGAADRAADLDLRCARRVLATERAGVPAFELPSGAGHDAMALAKLTDVAMLFTRCGNGGISHNPLETMTADDAEVSAQILLDFLRHFQPKH